VVAAVAAAAQERAQQRERPLVEVAHPVGAVDDDQRERFVVLL